MDKLKLTNVIDKLALKIPITEEQKKSLISRYESVDELSVLKELGSKIYEKLSNNDELYTYALDSIRELSPRCPSVEDMKKMLENQFLNVVEGNMNLEENHKIVTDALVSITKLLNESGIDYYIVGALPCFLKTGIPLFRYHDDIDIMVNEEQLDKVKEVIDKFGYIYQDDRYPSVERFHEMEVNKPPHTVLAQNPDNEFHLGFFLFKRNPDDSMTIREYNHRLEDDRVVIDLLERKYDSIGTQLRYDSEPTNYQDTTFRIGSVEDVYILKGYTSRSKDITDKKKLEPYIDQLKIKELMNNKCTEVKTMDYQPEELSTGRHL